MKLDAKNSLKRGLSRPVPSWVLGLVSLVSTTLLVIFVWGVCFPPQPYTASAFRDPEVVNKVSLIRPGSALDRNMRRVNVSYSVEAKEGEHFTVTYLDAKGKEVHVADAVATEVAGWEKDGAEVRSPDGVLLKRWGVQLRVDAGSLLFVSAQSKQPNSSLEVGIWVDVFDACRAITKEGQKMVSCRHQMPK